MCTRTGPIPRVMPMTTSDRKFNVRENSTSTATRPNGLAARQKLKALLGQSGPVIVDMGGVVLTPSFADEFLGVLLVELGDASFRRSIQIVNVPQGRSEAHTSELQSLMRISYAVFCLKKKKNNKTITKP